MSTVIAIEAKPLVFEGIDSGFFHLYLVKTTRDDQGHVISEKVIRGTLGNDGTLQTLADANLASSPDRRGSDTPQERHRTVLDLGGRDADDVWQVMVQHANNIDKANLQYGFDVFQAFAGGDVNSNTVAASVLHTVGIDWTRSLPVGISRSEVPLYGQLQSMKVNDGLLGTAHSDQVLGGVGNDRIYGGDQNDRVFGENGNDRLYGGSGDDVLSGGSGNDKLYNDAGVDTLRGGSGEDTFVFNTFPDNSTGLNYIRDFSVADDRISLNNNVFTALGAERQLISSAFWTGTAAHDDTDRVIYDRSHGVVYYDPDGTGAAEQVAITALAAGLKMTHRDFLVV